jgi:hypothetical protein
MNLPSIGLRRPHLGDKPMSNIPAGMRIALYAVIFNKRDMLLGRFAEPMFCVARNAKYRSIIHLCITLPKVAADARCSCRTRRAIAGRESGNFD